MKYIGYVEFIINDEFVFGGIFSTYNMALNNMPAIAGSAQYNVYKIPVNALLLINTSINNCGLGNYEHSHFNQKPAFSIDL